MSMIPSEYRFADESSAADNKLGLKLVVGALCLLLPLHSAISTALTDTKANNQAHAQTQLKPPARIQNQAPEPSKADDNKDDSELIVERIRESLGNSGLVSVEQHTGRILFNPLVDKLHGMPLKQKFFMPAMVVNQSQGLKLVAELPFSCFMLSAGELSGEQYRGYRQHDTLKYIRDVKNFPASRALICQTVGSTSNHWKKHLDLSQEIEQFVFEEHVSLSGEHFYYFVNADGSFEMYM